MHIYILLTCLFHDVCEEVQKYYKDVDQLISKIKNALRAIRTQDVKNNINLRLYLFIKTN
jgi:hypothetical protein